MNITKAEAVSMLAHCPPKDSKVWNDPGCPHTRKAYVKALKDIIKG
jgi:hypothetical protein